MIESQVLVVNRLGLHARAAAKLVALTSGFMSEVTVSSAHRVVNGKSIMGLMMLAASKGTELVLQVDGEDEEIASSSISLLFADKFGEGE